MSAIGPTAFAVLFWALVAVVVAVFCYEVYVLGSEFRAGRG